MAVEGRTGLEHLPLDLHYYYFRAKPVEDVVVHDVCAFRLDRFVHLHLPLLQDLQRALLQLYPSQHIHPH